MRIEPVEGTNAVVYPLPAPTPARSAVTPVTASDHPAARVDGIAIESEDRLAFRTVLRGPGVTVLRIVDTVTGDTLAQLPPEQVLRMVEDVVRHIRDQEASGGDQ
jgi:hypothetical protein